MAQCLSQRFFLSIMLLIAVGIVYTTRMALSVAIIKMAPQESENITTNEFPVNNGFNSTIPNKMPDKADNLDFDWSTEIQGYILSAVFIGKLLFQVPGGLIANRSSAKYLILASVGTNSLLTLLTPLCVHGDYAVIVLIVFRIIMGAAESCVLPGAVEMLIVWFPPSERTGSLTTVTSGIQLGSIIGAAFSGYLLSVYNGWSSVFYVYGLIGILWCIIFLFVCYDEPDTHPFISDQEKQYLKDEIKLRNKVRPPTPWKYILTSISVWASATAQFSFSFSFVLMISNLARYMTYVLKYPILESGLLCAIPYILDGLVNIIAGNLADFLINKSYISTTNLRKLFGFICLIIPPIAMLLAAYAENDRLVAVISFVIGIGLMGTFVSGIKVNSADLAPNYVSILYSLTNIFTAVASLIAPPVAAYMTPNSFIMEWKNLFWVNFIIAIPATLFYLICGSGEVQHWNNIEVKTVESTKM